MTTMSITDCLHLTQPLMACWAIVSALEWIANGQMFHSRGLLAWPVLRLRAGMTLRIGAESALGSQQAFVAAQIVRLVSGITLLLFNAPIVSASAIFVLVCTCAFTNFRACFGGDGSDQMGLIVAVGALFMATGLAVNDSAFGYSGVMLVGGQALLAYFVAGASKVISPVWRSGAAVAGVMQTTTFGNEWAALQTSRNSKISYFIGWFVILTEMLFPITFIAPTWLLVVMLSGFAIFHCVNAYFMGLNSFVISFLATYPAVIKMNFDLRSIL